MSRDDGECSDIDARFPSSTALLRPPDSDNELFACSVIVGAPGTRTVLVSSTFIQTIRRGYDRAEAGLPLQIPSNTFYPRCHRMRLHQVSRRCCIEPSASVRRSCKRGARAGYGLRAAISIARRYTRRPMRRGRHTVILRTTAAPSVLLIVHLSHHIPLLRRTPFYSSGSSPESFARSGLHWALDVSHGLRIIYIALTVVRRRHAAYRI